MTELEKVLHRWWNDEINVNEVEKSLVASLAASDFKIVKMRERKSRPFRIELYSGMARGGPFNGCEIESDLPSIADDRGGAYNYAGGEWRWVAGLGTELNDALSQW
jgi:hypothetical protein